MKRLNYESGFQFLRAAGNLLLYALVFIGLAVQVEALGKTGADPGAPAGGGDFVAGNAAVASEVNKQFNLLYKAFNDGTNSINIDAWTNTAGALGYTGGRLGVGIASPVAKFTLNQSGTTNIDALRIINGAFTHNIYSDAAGRLTLGSTTTPAAMVVQDNGLVGVGTASPLSTFHVNASAPSQAVFGTGLANALRIYPDTEPAMIWDSSTNLRFGTMTAINAGFSEKMRIQTNGNVGIGTSSPSNLLEVVSTTGAGTARGIVSTHYSTDITNGLIMARKARGTPAAPSAVSSGDQIGIFSFQGHDGTAFSGGGWLIAVATENWTGTGHGTRLSLATTAAGNTTTTTRVRIEDSGDVTIGSVAPSVALHIVGAACSTVASGITACASDERLKTNFSHLSDALTPLMKLRVKHFEWRKQGADLFGYTEGQKDLGLVAQEVEAINPAWVSQTTGGYKRINDGFLKFYSLRAIQQLHETGIKHKAETDTQVLALKRSAQALEKRATEAEQRYANGLRQAQSDKAAADARIAALEKRLNSELLARQQQDIRLAKLEQALQRQVVARK